MSSGRDLPTATLHPDKCEAMQTPDGWCQSDECGVLRTINGSFLTKAVCGGATARDFDSVCPEKQVTTRPGYRPVVTTTPDSYHPLNISNPPGGNARRAFQFHDTQPADRIPSDRCAAALRAQSAHACASPDRQDCGQNRGIWTQPILVDGDNGIIAGHGRLASAQKLGLDTVPVVVLEHLPPTQRRALIIADNRIAENAGWDDAMLCIELQSLQEDGFNLDITGFDADAMAEIMAGEETTVDGNTDEDAIPELSETAISRPGDVWILGNHRLVCGDATQASSYEQLLAG